MLHADAGMPKGEPSYVIVNLKDIDKRYKAGEEVTLESLKEKGIVRATGKEAKLPLKVRAIHGAWLLCCAKHVVPSMVRHNDWPSMLAQHSTPTTHHGHV